MRRQCVQSVSTHFLHCKNVCQYLIDKLYFTKPCVFRQDANRRRANEQLGRIRDWLALQQFMQDCDEVRDSRLVCCSICTLYFMLDCDEVWDSGLVCCLICI